MQDDDELCLCFHVTKRKVKNYIRIHRPRVASELSECGGAGTGCGWCRPVLRRLLEQAKADPDLRKEEESELNAADYQQSRQIYLKETKAVPPTDSNATSADRDSGENRD